MCMCLNNLEYVTKGERGEIYVRPPLSGNIRVYKIRLRSVIHYTQDCSSRDNTS
jgi:hypothetical protein